MQGALSHHIVKKKVVTGQICDKVVLSAVPVTDMGMLTAGSEFWLNFHQLQFEMVARYPCGIVQ